MRNTIAVAPGGAIFATVAHEPALGLRAYRMDLSPAGSVQDSCSERALGEPAIAAAVDKAIHDVLASGKIKSLSAGRMGMGTREVGDFVAKMVS